MGSGSLTRLFYVTWSFKPLTAVCVDMAQKMAGTRSRCRRHDVLTALAKQQKKKRNRTRTVEPRTSGIENQKETKAACRLDSLQPVEDLLCRAPEEKPRSLLFLFNRFSRLATRRGSVMSRTIK